MLEFDVHIAGQPSRPQTVRRCSRESRPMSFTLHGLGVSGGIAIGHAHLVTSASLEVIRRESCNAEWALKLQLDELLAQFADVQDEYLRERKTDVRQVAERIVAALSGQGGAVPEKLRERAEDTILVAHDLSPADVILFKDHQVAAFITDLGGSTSHTAILARGLAIPATVPRPTSRDLFRESELL